MTDAKSDTITTSKEEGREAKRRRQVTSLAEFRSLTEDERRVRDSDLPGDSAAGGMPLTVTHRGLRIAVYVTVAVISSMMVVTATLKFVFGHDRLLGFATLFDPRYESSSHSWFGASLLFVCGAILLIVGTARRKAAETFATQWLVLGAGFIYLSFDEAASMHERFIVLLRAAVGSTSFIGRVWPLVAFVPLTAIGVAFVPFVRQLPVRFRRALILAASVYFGGAVGMETIGMYWQYLGLGDGAGYIALAIIEETMELLGAGMFLCALVDFVSQGSPGIAISPVVRRTESDGAMALAPSARAASGGGPSRA